ncbi:uncharacterized protein LAESUDRAFT_340662 [Laetiporus sulphureus 93-53]|uniref:Uncharacterized protein n=1 Tax=Laetiporus sulphureus 93-53 TaxID=1314785 RepID=A0A165GP11_9APHY|nr:uncharacterized protein LAESUDRAFT_340662 [Laetiporus sulphureus 93-53]KZT10611.1 hypothetical protein LAESUDRAFT_340662 [Laetiporus sulphureus 93-53]
MQQPLGSVDIDFDSFIPLPRRPRITVYPNSLQSHAARSYSSDVRHTELSASACFGPVAERYASNADRRNENDVTNCNASVYDVTSLLPSRKLPTRVVAASITDVIHSPQAGAGSIHSDSSRSSSRGSSNSPCNTDLSVEAFALDVDRSFGEEAAQASATQMQARSIRDVSDTSIPISLDIGTSSFRSPSIRRAPLQNSISEYSSPSGRHDVSVPSHAFQAYRPLPSEFHLNTIKVQKMPSTARMSMEEAYGIRAPAAVTALKVTKENMVVVKVATPIPTDVARASESSAMRSAVTVAARHAELNAIEPIRHVVPRLPMSRVVETSPLLNMHSTAAQSLTNHHSGLASSSGTDSQTALMSLSFDLFEEIEGMLGRRSRRPEPVRRARSTSAIPQYDHVS